MQGPTVIGTNTTAKMCRPAGGQFYFSAQQKLVEIGGLKCQQAVLCIVLARKKHVHYRKYQKEQPPFKNSQ